MTADATRYQGIDDLLMMMMVNHLLDARDDDPSCAGNDFPADQVQDRYDQRARHLWMAAGVAAQCGIPVGVRQDPPLRPGDDAWPVLYFELPTGQLSWHMAPHPVPWDGHGTDEKYQRLDAWARDVYPALLARSDDQSE